MDVAYTHRAMTTEVSTSGSVEVDTGSWRVEVSCAADGNPTVVASVEQAGPGTISIPDVDAWMYRQGTAVDIVTQMILYEDVSGTWERYAEERHTETMSAKPAPTATKIGIHVYPAAPGTTWTTRSQWTDELDAMPAGIDSVRMGIAWAALQPSAQSTWESARATYLDGVFTELDSRGITVGLTVGTTPSWAGPGEFEPPTDPADVGVWVDDILDRWGATVGIDFIDVWNEPDQTLTASNMAASIVAMTRAAKSGAVGRTQIALPPLASLTRTELDAFVTEGLTASDFDVVDIHPYPLRFSPSFLWLDPSVPPAVAYRGYTPLAAANMVEGWLADNGWTKDIIVSEVGVGRYEGGPTGERIGDVRSADWHTVMLDQMLRHPDIGWVSIHEAAGVTGGVEGTSWHAGWGLVDADLNRRGKWQTVSDVLATAP